MELLRLCRGVSSTATDETKIHHNAPEKPDGSTWGADQRAKESVVVENGTSPAVKESLPTRCRAEIQMPGMDTTGVVDLDCYPYTFSPLLLFSDDSYFDKGYSNYNSVAQFFSSVLDVNMLDNVIYDRKNMLYEELLESVVTTPGMIVTCCIDSHFTAFQVIAERSIIYYNPLSPNLSHMTGDSCTRFAAFLLLKCNYADNQHIQENEDHYTGRGTNATRRLIYSLWREINKLDADRLYNVKSKDVALNLDRYLLINNGRNPRMMSTQETGNTCYFQTYLFAVLCKVCKPSLARDGQSLELRDVDRLERITIKMSCFLLEFFVQDEDVGKVMRPLTNSNVVLDFHRYEKSRYYEVITQYLRNRQVRAPDYELQHQQIMHYFWTTKTLHLYGRFQPEGEMPSTPNTKSLQSVCGTDDGRYKLGMSNYYKYRAANLMFGFNTGITGTLRCFCEFNSLRKNQLLAFYDELCPIVSRRGAPTTNKYRDYYFMAQFEIGQQELVDLHHYTYELDFHAMLGKKKSDRALSERVYAVNSFLVHKVLFSTQNLSDYDKLMAQKKFLSHKEYCDIFQNMFMTVEFFSMFAGLGFSDINLKEKEVNSLTQTVFYSSEMMQRQAYRMEYEFEKECINQMARSTLRRHLGVFDGRQDLSNQYRVTVKIGHGFTYSKYNTLMHFLNVIEQYWQNPDINSIQVFGKDIRTLLVISCQKIFFEQGHTYYHYGPFETGRNDLDLQVASNRGEAVPYVSSKKRESAQVLVVTDRVYEYGYLRSILSGLFVRTGGVRLKTDNEILNLSLLSLLLDFGLYDEHADSLNLPFLQCLQQGKDKRELQVEVSNIIHEFDKKNNSDSVTRLKLEELIFEVSYKFMVNKNFNVHSKEFELIRQLNSDPAYHRYLLLCKIYVSLCQINRSVEVDYYKIRCNNDYRIIIPENFSRATGEYLEQVTKQYTFSESDGFITYDKLQLFDVRIPQPLIQLYKVRFASATPVQSMVKYVEISNVFRASATRQHVIFIAGNVLIVEVAAEGDMIIRINDIVIEIATIFFNDAISFVPCFKYADSEDVILFTSRNIHYLVDKGGQFNENYYGMKHELMECINSEQIFVDLNDEHIFKTFKLSELLTESKTVIYAPDYLLQVQSRQQLINLLDFAIYIRNLSFFILVLFYLRRASVALEFIDRDGKVTKITGPWREAILYVLNRAPNPHYDAIFERQFFDLNQHEHLPLADFVEVLCTNFKRYQRFIDGQYQIIPTEKQKQFLQRIIRAEECFHFSEVGSGKTKVILPLLCQAFLSNNAETHGYLARGGVAKQVLVILVPEHLVHDAQAQVCRYCLNLNFREEYRIYDDIFALLHENVQIGDAPKRTLRGSRNPQPRMKQIFVTSFNQFKRALTYDQICIKIRPHRERILILLDEVDDFLDRDKLVFNICSNKNNDFKKPTLECYFEVSRAAYKSASCPAFAEASNPAYWQQLHEKFAMIHEEIQEKSHSINKSFGIFNEKTLRHCSSNITHDVEGYKSLIARPYESVNRAMPGSYYSDVERTIYLTYYILMEDIAKYDELFQEERKFISFEYFTTYIRHLDYDDLVYGNNRLSMLVAEHPGTKDGLVRFLYEIILRRMEIQDKSRSVNSVDVVFNFDCIGFTGTPFIDNYPTFAYIRSQRNDSIPDLINRSFYVYESEALPQERFEERFAQFQGTNNNVLVEYVSSGFVHSSNDELEILSHIFVRESRQEERGCGFNALVDLCGIFKKMTILDVRELILRHFGSEQFRYIYHIDQTDGSDRVLYINSNNDVQFDEEFYKYLCKTYGEGLREKVFFFIDNRNVIGKDIPFQLIHQRHFGQPLFFKSIVLAHDVDDFSKIWQAMGRSRTMNDTHFAIYKSNVAEGGSVRDIKKLPLTRELYIRNCDSKMVGNLSSIYQTFISLFNLSQDQFYHSNEIVNVFLEKMEMTLAGKVRSHEERLAREVIGTSVSCGILTHILRNKLQRSGRLASQSLTPSLLQTLLRNIVQQKFEQRALSGDIYDEFVLFLSGEQRGIMEISYTKQQQKQKQKTSNKNQDHDTMELFHKKHQLEIVDSTDNYFQYTLSPESDLVKTAFNLPISIPVFKLAYVLNGRRCYLNVYPTLQFLYSHHIQPEYITTEVREIVSGVSDPAFCSRFVATAQRIHEADALNQSRSDGRALQQLDMEVLVNYVRQNPLYTLAALKEGIYMIGMKDQFNIHDLRSHPMREDIQYIADEMGFILMDKSEHSAARLSVDTFGPYFIEQYMLMELLSKQEVAQTVIDQYVKHKEKLQHRLQSYGEAQGKGFICWRFIHDCHDRMDVHDDAAPPL